MRNGQQQHTENMARAVHELRVPLMSIRTASAVLAHSDGVEPLLPRMSAVIERQVPQMSRLVGDLLDVSRVGGGKLRVEPQPVDLRVLVDKAIDKRGQRLQLELPSVGPMLDADPLRLLRWCAICSTTPRSTRRLPA